MNETDSPDALIVEIEAVPDPAPTPPPPQVLAELMRGRELLRQHGRLGESPPPPATGEAPPSGP